jgi:hypothetical protein
MNQTRGEDIHRVFNGLNLSILGLRINEERDSQGLESGPAGQLKRERIEELNILCPRITSSDTDMFDGRGPLTDKG